MNDLIKEIENKINELSKEINTTNEEHRKVVYSNQFVREINKLIELRKDNITEEVYKNAKQMVEDFRKNIERL